MLMSVNNASEPNASGVRDCEVETRMRYPSPLSEPTNSPITAPMTAKVMAILRPTKMCGIAVGKRILTKVCSELADKDRIRSMSEVGTAVRPLVVATMIGEEAHEE